MTHDRIESLTPTALAQRLMADAAVAWGVGRLGALAEFSREASEPCDLSADGLQTARGALSLRLTDACRIYAGEALGHAEDGWSQWIAFTLPRPQARLAGRESIAELEIDAHAPRAQDRGGILFDLGIGGPHFEICVRCTDADSVAVLRSAVGRRLLEADALIHRLVAISPDRVFRSRLARIDVCQPIAAPDAHSPEGPHTHFLPHLLAGGDVYDGSAPPGWIAQCCAYPPSPIRDEMGRPKRFDRAQHETFQQILERFGDSLHWAVKRETTLAVKRGIDPGAMAPDSEAAKSSIRIALRQMRCAQGETAILKRWMDALDR
jgi:hypothetical protein